MEVTKKTLKRVKMIKKELLDLTEAYQKNVLERTDELEQLGHFEAYCSKEFSKKILALGRLVPPVEIEATINYLETLIKKKLVEMEQKIKKLKPKKKKKGEKKTIQQRLAVLSDLQ